jgi:hypothetical protein
VPRGGRRPGSGRKPKNVLGFPGGKPVAGIAASVVAPADLAVLAMPPADLRPAEQALWKLYALHAIEQRTLVPATVAGFRELVEVFVLKDDLHAKIQKFGTDGKSGQDRLRTYTRLSQRLDAALARYKLTAFGKPMDSGGGGAKKAPANPWAQVGP